MEYTFRSGQTMNIRPIQDLRAKDKDAYEAAIRFYIKFTDDGTPDLSDLPISMSMMAVQRNALFAQLIREWSFTGSDGLVLPIPTWNTSTGEIENAASIGELPIDDYDELLEFMRPYLAKVGRKPDPKGTTTASSNGSSPEKEEVSPTVSAQVVSGTSSGSSTTA